MTAQRGKDVLLKVGDGGTPTEIFTTVGGLRNTDISFSSRVIDATHVGSDYWQEILDDAGQRSVSITGNGLFTDSTSEDLIRTLAFGNTIRNFEITFGNGDVLTGRFKITSFSTSSPHDEEVEYSIALNSDGEITYMAA